MPGKQHRDLCHTCGVCIWSSKCYNPAYTKTVWGQHLQLGLSSRGIWWRWWCGELKSVKVIKWTVVQPFIINTGTKHWSSNAMLIEACKSEFNRLAKLIYLFFSSFRTCLFYIFNSWIQYQFTIVRSVQSKKCHNKEKENKMVKNNKPFHLMFFVCQIKTR